MCDACFTDRRPHARPEDDDFARPISRSAVHEANDRVRRATPEYHLPSRNTQIDTLAVQRHRARKTGRGDFDSVGDYLSHLISSGG